MARRERAQSEDLDVAGRIAELRRAGRSEQFIASYLRGWNSVKARQELAAIAKKPKLRLV